MRTLALRGAQRAQQGGGSVSTGLLVLTRWPRRATPPRPVLPSRPQLQCKLSEARSKLDGPVDPTTGRVLYKPQTGRGPVYARHAPEQAVGEYLYSLQTDKVS
jgi:hypothetical protein